MTNRQENKIGLCKDCRFHSLVRSNKGSDFHLCEYSKIDRAFVKYPKLPVFQCIEYSSAENTTDRE